MARPGKLTAVLLACLTGTGAADTLLLQDGRIFDGVKLVRGADGATVEFEHGKILVPWSKIRECIIPGDDGYQPKDDEERKKLDEGYVRYEGKWVKPAQRERAIAKLVADQQAAVEEMKASRLWRNRKTEETKNFIFDYTVPQHVFEGYRDLMETYYAEFVKAWKIKRPKDLPKLHVSFYVDYDAFLQVTGVGRGVLGFFRFVEPFELAIFYDRLDPRGTEEVIYHEVGHYLQRLIDVDFKTPHWPGEALSEYYAGSEWDPERKTLTTGLVMERRLSSMQLEIKEGNRVELEKMIRGCQDRNFWDYSWGWSFVHFLMSRPEYRDGFQTFFKALASDPKVERYPEQYGAKTQLWTLTGDEMLATFLRCMKLRKDTDLIALQEQWYGYIDEELAVTTTRGLEGAGSLAMQVDRKQRAKRLFEEAIATGNATPLAHYRLGQVLDELDDDAAAREHWAKAAALDPLVPEFYIEWGESLLRAKDDKTKEEGKRLLLLARDIEPDNFYLERNLERLLKK
jgi:tetratricopeptide (TPR) repeat protein